MLTVVTLHQNPAGAGDGAEQIVRYLTETEAMEYYSESGHVPMMTAGGAWAALGFSPDQKPTVEQMKSMLRGYGPSGEELAEVAKPRFDKETGKQISKGHRPGHDFTFSAPKSFSVLWGLSDQQGGLRQKLEAAHDESVRKAMDYLSQHVVVRKGKGGRHEYVAQNTASIGFRHTTNRDGDPQIHTHMLMLNLAQDEDGKWCRTDPAEAMRRIKEIGALYRAELAHQVRKLGFEVKLKSMNESQEISWEIDGMPQEINDVFSKRHGEIEALLRQWGVDTPEARKAACMATRKAKHISDEMTKHQVWQAEAREHGWTEDLVAEMQSREKVTRKLASAEAVQKLGAEKATFDQRKIDRAVAEAMQGVAGIDQRSACAGEFVSDPELLLLKAQIGEDGEKPKEIFRYTTVTNRLSELELLSLAKQSRGQGMGPSREVVDRAIKAVEQKRGLNFSEEQREALYHMASGDGSIRMVEGVAGAGKTVLVDVMREAYEQDGNRRVLGVAIAGKAASGLALEAGVRHRTIDSLLYALKREGPVEVQRGDVIIMDESNMSNTKQTLEVVKAARALGVDLVCIGHQKQLQAIGAGAAFAGLYKELGGPMLKESRRQADPEHRQAVQGIADGGMSGAVAYFRQQGRLHIAPEGAGIPEAVSAWKSSIDAGVDVRDAAIVTNRRTAADALNLAAREAIGIDQKPGQVRIQVRDREGQHDGERDFVVGDRVMGRKNSRKIGLNNGELGIIEGIDRIGENNALITIRKDDGKKISFTSDEYNNLDYGYSFTVHKAEGISVKAAVAHVSDMNMNDLHAAYVMLTRSKDAAHSHLVVPEFAIETAEQLHGLEIRSGGEEETPEERLANVIKRASEENVDKISLKFDLDEGWAMSRRPDLVGLTPENFAERMSEKERRTAETGQSQSQTAAVPAEQQRRQEEEERLERERRRQSEDHEGPRFSF